MPSPRASSHGSLIALSVIAGLLGLVSYQLHGVEERLVVQGQQLRALGEATDRLAAGGPRPVAAAPSGQPPPVAAGDPTAERSLHPGTPNFLVARGKRWPAAGAYTEGTLFRGWSSGDPKGFNPLLENAADLSDLVEALVATPIANRNVWTDPDTWYGELAERVEITDDSREITVYLRRGVRWQTPANVDLDGRHAWLAGKHEVTSDDLVFTFDLVMNPQVENGFMKNYYSELESWKALDPYTFVVRWKKKLYLNVETTLSTTPIPRFLFAFDEQGKPIPKETLGLRFNQHWYNNKGYVGAGPYAFAEYRPGSRIRLARSEQYYADRPAIREVSYPIYTDPNQTLLKLKAHELSVGGLTPGQYREEIFQYEGKPVPAGSPFFDGRIQCTKIDNAAFSYIGWNASKPLFADRRVRRAMTMALNRQQIIDSVFVGLGALTTGPFLHSGPYYDRTIAPVPFDLAGAKALLADAGWTDTDGDGLVDRELHPGDGKRAPFEFSLLVYGTSKEYASLANVFKEDLLKIGVKLNVETAEWSLMQKRMDEKTFDAFTGGWALGWDVDLYQIWHSSQADVPKGSNRVGFKNAEADKIIEALRETFAPDERVRLAHRFHALVHEEQPYTFLMTPKGVYCTWNDVKDVAFAKVRPIANPLPWSMARGAN